MATNGWSQVYLKDISTTIRNGFSCQQNNGNNGLPVTRIETISDGYIDFNRIGYANIDKNILEPYLLQHGDILFSHINSVKQIGKVAIFENQQLLYHGMNLLLIRINKEIAIPKYVYHVLCNRHTKTYFEKHSKQAVNQASLNQQDVGMFMLLLPSLNEQNEIALILDIWDKAILKTINLIEIRTKFKQALMQQLLTGKRRFKAFIKSNKKTKTHFGNIPSDWQYLKIKGIAEEVSERNEKGLNIPVLSCTKYDGLVDSLQYFGRRIFSEDTSVYKIVRRGQFAYATNHIEEGSIGLLDSINEGLVSPMYTVFKIKDDIFAPYLYKVFKTELYRHTFEINTSASVDRRGSLRWKQFNQIHIPLPTIEEQKKISACIDVCNNEIKLLQQLAETLNIQKKGLMQKLLTGKIRVKV